MHLDTLSLLNYKNFATANFDFDPKINCLVGPNGVGKTNVLDSIYHLAFGKSYFNPITSQNIKHSTDFFVIDGKFQRNERVENIMVSAKKRQKKIIKRNGKAYEKLSDHIGFLPLVIISPTDRDLITEGSETRRKFMDGVIAQSDKTYLESLLKYNKTLAQRNALLKYFAANRTHDAASLSVYNHQLQETGPEIHKKRIAFTEKFIPIFKKRYAEICNDREDVDLSYKSSLLQEEFGTLLEKNLQRDLALQYTSVGTHKDDLLFGISKYPVKKFGSQGQQKSYLIALKLAQYDFIKAQSGQNPILLLDDVFDKLDEERVSQIVDIVTRDGLGQLFISDTHSERTEKVVSGNTEHYKMIKLGA